MLKILIAGTIATSTVKSLWSHISDSLQQRSPYTKVNTMITYLFDSQQEDLMTKTVQKKLANPNVNV